jgi:hypothetical protein
VHLQLQSHVLLISAGRSAPRRLTAALLRMSDILVLALCSCWFMIVRAGLAAGTTA